MINITINAVSICFIILTIDGCSSVINYGDNPNKAITNPSSSAQSCVPDRSVDWESIKNDAKKNLIYIISERYIRNIDDYKKSEAYKQLVKWKEEEKKEERDFTKIYNIIQSLINTKDFVSKWLSDRYRSNVNFKDSGLNDPIINKLTEQAKDILRQNPGKSGCLLNRILCRYINSLNNLKKDLLVPFNRSEEGLDPQPCVEELFRLISAIERIPTSIEIIHNIIVQSRLVIESCIAIIHYAIVANICTSSHIIGNVEEESARKYREEHTAIGNKIAESYRNIVNPQEQELGMLKTLASSIREKVEELDKLLLMKYKIHRLALDSTPNLNLSDILQDTEEEANSIIKILKEIQGRLSCNKSLIDIYDNFRNSLTKISQLLKLEQLPSLKTAGYRKSSVPGISKAIDGIEKTVVDRKNSVPNISKPIDDIKYRFREGGTKVSQVPRLPSLKTAVGHRSSMPAVGDPVGSIKKIENRKSSLPGIRANNTIEASSSGITLEDINVCSGNSKHCRKQ